MIRSRSERSLARRLLPLAAVFFGLAATARADVAFRSIPFPEARQQAAREHKGVMVDFFTDWCYWCKVLDQRTYTAEKVSTFAEAQFVCVKIDAEKGDGVGLAATYGVHGYPTVLFLDTAGTETFRVTGFQPPDRFMQSMRVATTGSTAALEAFVAAHPDSAMQFFALGEHYEAAGDRDAALRTYRRALALDARNRAHVAEQAAFALARDGAEHGDNDALERYVATYPASDATHEAHAMLAAAYMRRRELEKAVVHFDAAIAGQKDDPEVLSVFAWQCAEQNTALPKALGYVDRALATHPQPADEAAMLNIRGEILYRMGRVHEATAVVQRALDILPLGGNEKLRYELEHQRDRFQKGAK